MRGIQVENCSLRLWSMKSLRKTWHSNGNQGRNIWYSTVWVTHQAGAKTPSVCQNNAWISIDKSYIQYFYIIYQTISSKTCFCPVSKKSPRNCCFFHDYSICLNFSFSPSFFGQASRPRWELNLLDIGTWDSTPDGAQGRWRFRTKMWQPNHNIPPKTKPPKRLFVVYSEEHTLQLCIILNPTIISHTSWLSMLYMSLPGLHYNSISLYSFHVPCSIRGHFLSFRTPPAPASATHPHSWLLESASDWPLRMLGHPNDWIKPAAWCKVPAACQDRCPRMSWKAWILLVEILRTCWLLMLVPRIPQLSRWIIQKLLFTDAMRKVPQHDMRFLLGAPRVSLSTSNERLAPQHWHLQGQPRTHQHLPPAACDHSLELPSFAEINSRHLKASCLFWVKREGRFFGGKCCGVRKGLWVKSCPTDATNIC